MAKNRHKTGQRHGGIAAMRKPPAIIPGLGVDVPELQRARTLWGLNRLDESLKLFEEAVRKYPQNLVALVDASRALGSRFEIRRAEAMLDRMVKLGAQQPQVLHLAGQSYRMIFRPERAMECLERVISLTRQIPDAYLELAILYERRHRLDEAFRLIEDCLRSAPDYLEAELFKARLLRRLKNEANSETTFRTLAANEQAHPEVRAQAWAEIAHLHDRLADYDAAMQAMLKSKELLIAKEGAILRHADTVMGHLRALVDSLTKAHFDRWCTQGQAFDPRNVAVLTGFPRSGTTLLEQVLDSHSGVVSSDEREAFARDIFPAMWLTPETPLPTPEVLDAVSIERLKLLRERYLTYMEAALDEPIGKRLHLDKNPTLTVVLPGLLRLFPETRCLIALRDPRDVVISCFMQYLPLNANSVYFLTLERVAQRYANDMGIWLKLREKIASPWLEVRYENTVTNLETEARRTLEFLGLAWEPDVLSYRERLSQKAVASPTYEAVSQPLYTRAIGRWRNYEKHLQASLPHLRPALEALGYA
jgi:tetratricopeptide (TPR) repeat protein